MILEVNIHEEDRENLMERFKYLQAYLQDYMNEYDLLKVNPNNYPRYRAFVLNLDEQHSQKSSRKKSRSDSRADIGKVDFVIDAPAPYHIQTQQSIHSDITDPSREAAFSKMQAAVVDDLEPSEFIPQKPAKIQEVVKSKTVIDQPPIQTRKKESLNDAYALTDVQSSPRPAKIQVEDEFFEGWSDHAEQPAKKPAATTQSQPVTNFGKPPAPPAPSKPTVISGPQHKVPSAVNNTVKNTPLAQTQQKSAEFVQPTIQHQYGHVMEVENFGYDASKQPKTPMVVQNAKPFEQAVTEAQAQPKVKVTPIHSFENFTGYDKSSAIEEYKPIETNREKEIFKSFGDTNSIDNLQVPKGGPVLGKQEEISQQWPNLSGGPQFNSASTLKKIIPNSIGMLLSSTLVTSKIPGEAPNLFLSGSDMPSIQPKTFSISSSFIKPANDYYYRPGLVNPSLSSKPAPLILSGVKEQALTLIKSQMEQAFGDTAPGLAKLNKISLGSENNGQNKPPAQNKNIKIQLDDQNSHVPIPKSSIFMSQPKLQRSLAPGLKFTRSVNPELKVTQFVPIDLNHNGAVTGANSVVETAPHDGNASKYRLDHYIDHISKNPLMAEPRFYQRLQLITNFLKQINDPNDMRLQRILPQLRNYETLLTQFEQEKNILEVTDEICKVQGKWDLHSSNDSLQDKERRRNLQLAEDSIKREVVRYHLDPA